MPPNRRGGIRAWTNSWDANAATVAAGIPRGDEIVAQMRALYQIVAGIPWYGACHATTAVLHVSLSEIGIANRMFLGQVGHLNNRGEPRFFDHSWIDVEGNVFDIALAFPLDPSVHYSPVVASHFVENGLRAHISYGVRSGLPFDDVTHVLTKMPFEDYMSGWPSRPDGLWSIAADVLDVTGDYRAPGAMRGKYKTVRREVVAPL